MSSSSASRVLDISGTSRLLTARMVGPGPDGLDGRRRLAGEDGSRAGHAGHRRTALEVAHRRLAERARADVGVPALQNPADDGDEADRPPGQAAEAEPGSDHG